MKGKMKSIVLASSSARRRALLRQIGLKFIVDPSRVEEKLNPRLKPRGQVEAISLQKAQAVAKKYKDAIVIAADTLVVFEDEILGKPADEKDARRILRKLSGKTQSVVTGFTVIDCESKKCITKSAEVKVYFKKLSDKEIKQYILLEKPLDKAGSYGVLERGAIFVEKVEGDFFAAVGLPLSKLAEELRRFGVMVLE